MDLIRIILNTSHHNKDNVPTVHMPSKDINFIRSRYGLYYQNCSPGYSAITMVQTVESNAEGFTNRQVTTARQDHHTYDMVGRPSPQDLEQMVRANMIHIFSITVADIKNTHIIFGPDVGSIRSKKVRSQSVIVVSDYIAILPIVMEQNIEFDLTGDIVLVNKSTFLVALGQRIKFTTVENLMERKATTVMIGLNAVINLYSSQHFKIKTMYMDNEFEVLDSALKEKHINLFTTAEDEHVPEIERKLGL